MRLIFLTNYYPPHHHGGYEELCADVAQGLRGRGHEVAVLTSDHGTWGKAIDEPSIYRLLHPEVDRRPYRATINFFVRRQRHLSESLASLSRTVADFRPDVLLVWGMWNLPRILPAQVEGWGQPAVVYYIADYWPTLPDAYTLHWQQPARRWYTRLPKKLLGQIALWQLSRDSPVPALRFDHALCVSEAVRQKLIEFGLPPDNLRVVYNGIDVDLFSTDQHRGSASSGSGSLSLLYAGRLARDKGVHTAIAAVGLLSQKGYRVPLVVVGRGDSSYEDELQRLAERLGVADLVEFRGRVPRQDMPRLLLQFDVLIVPSLWPEPMPRIAQEGMAAGLVVLGTQVGGMPEILVHGANGLLFPPGDADALALQIERLTLDPGLRQRLAQTGRETVRERFDVRRMLDQLEEYLAQAVKAQP